MAAICARVLERLDWPLLTLELRRARRSEKSFVYSLVVAVVLGVVGMLVALNLSSDGLSGWWVAQSLLESGQILLVLLFTIIIVTSYSARTIAAERDTQRFDHLAMTAMSSRAIILQKAAWPVICALAVALVLLPADLLVSAHYGRRGWSECSLLIWLLTSSVLNMSIGVLASCLFAKARTATAFSFLVILVGPLLLKCCLVACGFSLWMSPFLSEYGNSTHFVDALWSLGWSALTAAVLLHIAAWKLESLRRSA